MTPKVYISAHCRNPDLFGATKLVFETLRVGFPTAEVVVFDNSNAPEHRVEIAQLCNRVGASLVRFDARVSHADWVERIFNEALADENSAPFYLCDTDVIFWQSFEGWRFETALAGRAMPRFFDTYTKCETQPRLHTSLLYLNPAKVRAELAEYRSHFPLETDYNPLVNLVRPFFHRDALDKNIFYDSCAMLSYHVTSTRFTEEHLDCYDHLNCGTFADLLEPHDHEGMVERQKAILANPELARGLWKEQNKFYDHHRI